MTMQKLAHLHIPRHISYGYNMLENQNNHFITQLHNINELAPY